LKEIKSKNVHWHAGANDQGSPQPGGRAGSWAGRVAGQWTSASAGIAAGSLGGYRRRGASGT